MASNSCKPNSTEFQFTRSGRRLRLLRDRWPASCGGMPVVPRTGCPQQFVQPSLAEMLLHAQTPTHVKAAKPYQKCGRVALARVVPHELQVRCLVAAATSCNFHIHVTIQTSTLLQRLAKAPAEAVAGMEGGGDGGFIFRLWALFQKVVSLY